MTPTTLLALAAATLLAAFSQTLSGFGFTLVIMPLAVFAVGLRTAAPLVALAGLTLYSVNLFRYRRSVDWRELGRLVATSAFGVPVGIWAVSSLDESLIKALLGFLLIGYGTFELARPNALALQSPRWGLLAGFLSGCFGGAYNTPGPPVVVYGSMRRWPRDEFRAVLQALFFFNGTLTVTSHAVAKHITSGVWLGYAAIAPALLIGSAFGSRMDGRLTRDRFRLVVVGMILALGVSLLANALWG